eukprot:scaffold1314_cov386-Pavlova_lutheri.AAC.8
MRKDGFVCSSRAYVVIGGTPQRVDRKKARKVRHLPQRVDILHLVFRDRHPACRHGEGPYLGQVPPLSIRTHPSLPRSPPAGAPSEGLSPGIPPPSNVDTSRRTVGGKETWKSRGHPLTPGPSHQ